MDVIKIADAADEKAWLKERRKYLTASEIFKALSHEQLCALTWWRESWMDETLDDVLSRKVTEEQPEFRDPVAVKWGQVEEDHNRELFGKYAGVPTMGSRVMLTNTRWPYLATTLDGFVWRPRTWSDVDYPEMFDAPGQVRAAIEALPVDEQCLLEMKQTSDYGYSPWSKGYSREPMVRGQSKVTLGRFSPKKPTMPVYYLSQVQTQLAITGFECNLAVVKAGASHMTCHLYWQEPLWLKILDDINEKVAARLDEIRKQVTDE